jgi:hypothetical protein
MTRRLTTLVIPFLGVALFFAATDSRVAIRICRTLEEAVPPGTDAVLLVFFSTDCPVCYDGLFESRYAVDEGGWPVKVVGVYSGSADSLRSFLEKYGWTLPVVLDRRKSLARKFRVDSVPDRVLLVAGEPVYRDDPRADPARRREDLARCLNKAFSR